MMGLEPIGRTLSPYTSEARVTTRSEATWLACTQSNCCWWKQEFQQHISEDHNTQASGGASDEALSVVKPY